MSVDLLAWQQNMADLINGDLEPGDEAWRERTDVVREVVGSWRELRIRSTCPLTSTLLEERGAFRDVVAQVSRDGVSPYHEAFAMAFLHHVAETYEDEEVAAVAAYEEERIRANHA